MRKAVPAVCFFCFIQVALAADAPRKGTYATGMALQGPIHTQLMTVQKLARDPRPALRLPIWSPPAWLEFDRNGDLIEQANELDADGAPARVQRMKYDAQGRELESLGGAGGGAAATRYETVPGPFGPIESRTYVGNVLQNRSVSTYDAGGRLIEAVSYDASGAVINDVTYRYDEHGREAECTIRGSGHRLTEHTVQSYTASGDLGELTWFDERGALVRRLVLEAGDAIDYWQDPAWKDPSGMGLAVWEPGSPVTYAYNISGDTFLKTVQRHASGRGNIENDSEEMYDRQGNLVEELTFDYQRDAHGNWTDRVISAWDAASDEMLPIEADHRVLTYYP